MRNAPRRLLWMGIWLVLGSLPLCPPSFLGLHPHDLARLAQILLLAMAVCCAVLLPNRTVHVGYARLIALLGGGALAVAAAPHIEWAVREWLLAVSLCAMAGVIARSPLKTVKGLISGVAFAFGAYGLGVLVLLSIVGMQDPANLRADAIPGYGNHRFFNHVQTVLLPIIALGAYQTRTQVGRLLLWMCSAAHIALLLFTGGRATMLSLVVGGALALWASASLRRASTPIGAAVLAGAVLYGGLLVLLPASLGAASAEPLTQRLATVHTVASRWDAWQLAWRDAVAHPWLGIGPMHFAAHAESPIAHPHNLFLQLLSEWGAPFTAAAIILMCRGMYALVDQVRSGPSADGMMGPLLAWGCSAAFLDAFFSGNAVMPNSQVAISMCCGAAGAWYGEQRVERMSWRVQRPVSVVVLLGTIWLTAVSIGEALNLDEHLEAARGLARLPFGDAYDPPRFWSNGRF